MGGSGRQEGGLHRSTSTLSALKTLTSTAQEDSQAANAIDSAGHRGSNVSTLVAVAKGTKVRIFDADMFLFKTRECQHIVTVKPIKDDFAVDLDKVVCSTCHTQEENWFCLVCHEFFCGRFANKHMLQHHAETGHCVSMSMTDLSVWCYGCDMYLNHDFFPRLYHFFSRMHRLKFREEPQNAATVQTEVGEPVEGEEALLFWENLGPMGELMCSHAGNISNDIEHVTDFNAPCETCAAMGVTPSTAASQENWICLTCGGVESFVVAMTTNTWLSITPKPVTPCVLACKTYPSGVTIVCNMLTTPFFRAANAYLTISSKLKFGYEQSKSHTSPAQNAHFQNTSYEPASTYNSQSIEDGIFPELTPAPSGYSNNSDNAPLEGSAPSHKDSSGSLRQENSLSNSIPSPTLLSDSDFNNSSLNLITPTVSTDSTFGDLRFD
eukprot:CAMPEP_0171505080 /NCGR_PEP_ID=MMETSP0958-20121227/11988_1 /TAXON_ID=87120 /ORGANISM="Aurantiochytrium limacinum, Strain ATCCMYA-1381" /LENGTH=436 /DNA_ID=CAMNT_0012041113 /DNA_START=222 /DNA_END=1531 /DNA_ORIENTATION=-